MKYLYQLHLHMNSGRIASLRPCGDYAVTMDADGIHAIKLSDHEPLYVGQRYAMIESIKLKDVQYVEVEVLGYEEEGETRNGHQ